MIRAMVVSAALGAMASLVPAATFAQGLDVAPIAALPSPRLVFSTKEMELAQAVAAYPGLADFYSTNGLIPAFTGPDGAALRGALIAAVGTAASHGLPPARFNTARLVDLDRQNIDTLQAELAFAVSFQRWSHDITGGILDPMKVDAGIKRKVQRPATGKMLRDFVAADDPAVWLEKLAPQDRNYQALRRALQGRAQLAVPATTPLVPDGTWREGMVGPQIAALRTRLQAMGFAAPPLSQPDMFDAPLAEALRGFQMKAGVTADGVAGPRTVARLNGGPGDDAAAILVAMERMRWMYGRDPDARQVWVNLPEFSARILENGREVFFTRTVIGKADPEYETPEFSETMKYMVANPRWNVPRSITVKEYLPRLQANRNAVSNLDVVDGAGNVITRDRIEFGRYTAENFPFRMRQKPSDDNALGAVKFMFPNPWNIYLHDTPTKQLFATTTRAYSHGCIRIARPMDLAHQLLQGQVDDPQAVFAKALASGKETFLNLKTPIPVHLVYFTAFPDKTGKIQRFPDIYGRDARVYAALMQAGNDSGLDSVAVGN